MRIPLSRAGGNVGAPQTHSAAVSRALDLLSGSATVWLSILILSLVVQAGIWIGSAYTDVRFEHGSIPYPVASNDAEPERVTSLDALAGDVEPEPAVAGLDPNRVPSRADVILHGIAVAARVLGTTAMLLSIPIIGLGVTLAAGSATNGIDRTASSFNWCMVLGILVLPVGSWVGLPWQNGALWDDGAMMSALAERQGAAPGGATLARYLLLPIASAIGAVLVLVRFRSGVAAGRMIREDLSLDPLLEKEAGNVKPTSLHGGRAAAALSRVSELQGGGAEGDSPSPQSPVGRIDGEAPPRRVI